jgi:hypothetical protein
MMLARQTTLSLWMSRGAVAFVLAVSSCAPHPAAVARPSPARQGVVRRTLANGLEVIVVPSALAPVVTTMVNYRVGSIEAPQGFPRWFRPGDLAEVVLGPAARR